MTVVYNGTTKHIKVFDETGKQILQAPARNDSVAPNAWRPDAGCPPGTYTLGKPEPCNPGQEQTEMGPWFIPVNGIPGHEGIGIHGGGSCVYPHSMDDFQGWCPTENCIRLQNYDLKKLVALIPDGGSTFEVYQTP